MLNIINESTLIIGAARARVIRSGRVRSEEETRNAAKRVDRAATSTAQNSMKLIRFIDGGRQ
jgi:hypothetical protein